jgi:thiol-disulfide isomerase/thioredoxin
MKVTLIGALVVSLGSQTPPAGQPATAQAITTQAIADAAAPADCVKALRSFVSKRQQELRPPTGFTAELLKQVDGEKLALAATCVARFDAKKIEPSQLSGLAELYTEARLPVEAEATLERALAATLAPAERANTLIAAMNAIFGQPKSDARNARLEAMVDELDANPGATFDQKWAAHGRMAGYYRGDDIDAGIIKHGRWMAEAAKSFIPDQRTKYGSRLVSSQVSVAEALAGQGMNDEALDLLRRTAAEWKDIARATEQIAPVLERYLLVGTAAAPIKAPRWLNAPAGVTEMPMTGAVTLLEFTAHWCGPCRESYPGVNRLRQQFGPQGFRVVMATRYYGYFSTERNLTAEDELKRDAEYFKNYQLDVPVAVGDQVSVKVVDGKVTYVPGPDPNDTSYKVGGIPQIHLIDKQGRIRLIMVGYDDANEPKLADTIRKLLAEK